MPVEVSIVIPVYNGQSFLEETISSLWDQTYKEFEIICVDDSSTDNSYDLLKSLALKDSRLKVYQKENGGTAAKAIIYGLQFASGNYFMYSSQDDIFSSDLLEKNVGVAKTLNVDAVVPDMILYWDNKNSKRGIFGINGDRSRVITGREAVDLSLDWTIHGFVLWKMETVRSVGFYDFGMNSDEFTTRALYLGSKKVAFSDGKFYYRQNNTNAITKRWNANQLDCFDTSHRLETFLLNNGFNEDAIYKVHRIIFIDLIRLQLMYLRNKTRMSTPDQLMATRGIKSAYYANYPKIKSLHSASLKQFLVTKAVSLGYPSFLVYTYLHFWFRKIFK